MDLTVTQKSTPLIVTLAPDLKNAGEGHHYIYNKSVQDAVESLGWKYKIAIPKNIVSSPLPHGWFCCLPAPPPKASRTEIVAYIRLFCISILPIFDFLRPIAQHSKAVLFIESINPFSLMAFTISMVFVPRKNLAVWFLYRGEHTYSGLNKIRGMLEFIMQKTIQRILPAGRFKLLSDSVLLAEWYGTLYGQNIAVMPIPHTDLRQKAYGPQESTGIICWMAGQQHAIPHNVSIIKNLASLITTDAREFTLYVSEKSGIEGLYGGINIQKLPPILSQTEYEHMFTVCDIILLPYDPRIHNMRTSGVFVECIIAGKMPIVSKGTWMATELNQHQLSELSVEWATPDIFSKMLRLNSDPAIRDKLEKMRIIYHQFHNKSTYADRMRKLYAESFK